MTAGFMFVTMERVVWDRTAKFFLVEGKLSCLDLFQSRLMKIMFTLVVLCCSGTVPRSEAADDVEADHAESLFVLIMLHLA